MHEIISCPHCGVLNSVSDNTFGRRYICHSCANEFSITNEAKCPHCGKLNLLKKPNKNMAYRCYSCGQVFHLISTGGKDKSKSNKSADWHEDRREKPSLGLATAIMSFGNVAAYILSPAVALLLPFSYCRRASRLEFVGVLVVHYSIFFYYCSVGDKSQYSAFLFISWLYTLLCLISCGTRRAHDSEQGEAALALLGKFALALFIAPCGLFAAVIFVVVALFYLLRLFYKLSTAPGVPFPNQYGSPIGSS